MNKGQSAIEYLMTYGWMLLALSVVGGAIFTLVDDENIKSTQGFQSGHIEVMDVGVNSNNDLDVLIRNTGSGEVEINSINVTDDNGESVLIGGPEIDVADERDFRVKFLEDSETDRKLDVEIIYDQDDLKNLTTEGVVTGSLDLSNYSSYEWWWNRDWSYRRPVQISEESGDKLRDYNAVLTVDTASLISEGKLSGDCSDLRVVDQYNEDLLNYWVEDGCDTADTDIITELNLSEDSSKEIYLYYGNSGVGSSEDANSTLFIHDLHGNGHNGVLTGSATYNSTNEYVEFSTPSGGNGGLFYDRVPKPGFEAKFQYYAGDGSGADATFLAAYLTDTVNREQKNVRDGYRYALDEWQGNIQINSNGDRLVTSNPGFDIDNSTWREVKVRFNGDKNHEIEVNGSTIISQEISLDREKNGTYFGWGGRTGGSTNYHRVRNLTVRKYTEPSPSIDIGDEESP